MQWLKDFLNDFFYSLLDVVFWLIDNLFDLITTPLYWLYDGFLTIVSLLISSINLSSLGFQTFAGWSGMPTQLVYIINELALPQCVTIIVGAMTIRLLLNIIPAALTRV